MTQNFDTLEIGDLVSANYLKNIGDVNSRALEILYKTEYRSDLTAQDVGVKNDGVSDTSNVFEIKARYE